MAGKVGLFHPGIQHSWQTARALQELGRLQFYATSIFYQQGRWPYVLEGLPGPAGRALRSEFSRFKGPALDPALLKTGGWHEWAERLVRRAGLHRLAGQLDRIGNNAFQHKLDREIRSDAPFALWGFNNSAGIAFETGRAGGRLCILDRTIGDPRAYNRDMASLQEGYGDWFLDRGVPYDEAYIQRAEREHDLAHRILVGCPFAADTLKEFSAPENAAKVEVLEYCFDETNYSALPPPAPRPAGTPVRFLFLGLAIPRKGIHHVLEAIAQIPASQASLTIVGQIGVPHAVFNRYADRVTHIPTVPRSHVPQIMQQHDVLLFPTYFEGAGIVLYEALACGMGIIQTNRAALAVTPDTGLLIPRPDTDLLQEAMLAAIAQPERVEHWRQQAQGTAARYHFSGYRERIGALLERVGA